MTESWGRSVKKRNKSRGKGDEYECAGRAFCPLMSKRYRNLSKIVVQVARRRMIGLQIFRANSVNYCLKQLAKVQLKGLNWRCHRCSHLREGIFALFCVKSKGEIRGRGGGQVGKQTDRRSSPSWLFACCQHKSLLSKHPCYYNMKYRYENPISVVH